MDHRGEWVRYAPFAATVTDRDGVILEMNDAAVETFKDDGGASLVGTNVLDCHPEPSKSQLRSMLENQTANSYTIEKHGRKKLIHQVPWYKNGEYAGFVELSLELPTDPPHFERD